MSQRKYILSNETAEKKLRRMALEVAERNYGEPVIILFGIKENGIVIAHKIKNFLQESFEGEVLIAAVSFDKKLPAEIKVDPVIDVNGKVVLVVDDVANSGKAIIYSLKPLLASHPKKIQTLALVERTHKSFPVVVDYVGLSISTTLDENIVVEVEGENITGAWME